jgi:broad specificity phosphatase PhoE
MVIYLVRHGETDWNLQNRLQGVEDIELNETGLLQSAECAGAFTGIAVECILSSPLKRAKKTADIIAEQLGVGPVIVERDLTERDFGRLSGLTLEERQALLDRGENTGAEPLETLIDRFVRVLDRYAGEATYKSMIVVSHGASINATLSHLSGGEIGTGKTILKNVCISKICYSGGQVEIAFYNLTPEEFLSVGQ